MTTHEVTVRLIWHIRNDTMPCELCASDEYCYLLNTGGINDDVDWYRDNPFDKCDDMPHQEFKMRYYPALTDGRVKTLEKILRNKSKGKIDICDFCDKAGCDKNLKKPCCFWLRDFALNDSGVAANQLNLFEEVVK